MKIKNILRKLPHEIKYYFKPTCKSCAVNYETFSKVREKTLYSDASILNKIRFPASPLTFTQAVPSTAAAAAAVLFHSKAIYFPFGYFMIHKAQNFKYVFGNQTKKNSLWPGTLILFIQMEFHINFYSKENLHSSQNKHNTSI